MAINWLEIAKRTSGLESDGRERVPGTDGARRALEIIIGEQEIRDAVDWWADQKPGAFTAEMVLRIIASTIAMERCYEIYKNEPETVRASAVVFLLSEIADSRVLPWAPEFISDSSSDVRWNGMMAL